MIFSENQDNLLEKLSRWDKERRNYPYDWEALSRLQNELSSELSGYLYQLRQIEAGYDKKNEGASYPNLDTAISLGSISSARSALNSVGKEKS